MRLREFDEKERLTKANEKLKQYKTAAGADATAADAEGNFARGHRRFKGIGAATKKQFDNDAKLAKLKEQGVAEGSLNEFSQGSDGGESGRWYTDDEMTDIVGDGWWQDMDVSGANIGVIDSEVPKEYMIQQAQAWLDDQGYSVQVLNCKVNDDDMEWYIEGSFQNSGFAKKGVAEGEKHGLYYNVNKRKAAGTSRPASSSKAPTAQAWKDAAKTAKNESVAEDSLSAMRRLAGVTTPPPASPSNGPRQYRHMPTAVQPR